MIDWWLLVRNAVWIVGAAMAVWWWSHERWLTLATGKGSDLALMIGTVMICVGQASLQPRWWGVAGWMVLGAVAALRLRHSVRAVA